MKKITKDLEADESFVIELIAQTKGVKGLAEKLTKMFNLKYEDELGKIEISFDQIAKNWKIKTKKKEKTVEYPEAIPKALRDLRD